MASMKRILVIANNLAQASYRLRIAALIEPLSRRGFELDVRVRPRNFLARRRLLRSASDYDAVLLQRKLLDPGDARLLRRCARRIFYDVDDAVMFDQKPRGRLSQWRLTRRFEATASILDCAVVGNEYLAGLLCAKTSNVAVLPTVVDPAHYPVKSTRAGDNDGVCNTFGDRNLKPSPDTPGEGWVRTLHRAGQGPHPCPLPEYREREKEPPIRSCTHNDAVRLVWVGSHSTIGYLETAVPWLEAAHEQLSGVRLLIVADATLQSGGMPIEHEPWSPQTESAALLRGDIGIAPTPLNRWTLGKCGFKIIQYMAAGLPVIASPVGANAQIVKDGETGFLAETPEQWRDAIVKLARDPDLRQSMGQAGRRRVEAHYNLDRAVETWSRILAM